MVFALSHRRRRFINFSQHFETLGAEAGQTAGGDVSVKCDETTAIFLCQRDEVQVREMTGRKNTQVIKPLGIGNRDSVGPECVIRVGNKDPERFNEFDDSETFIIGILLRRHDANQAILRNRATRPGASLFCSPPFVSAIVKGMIRIEQRDEKVDIE
jgi:hypothetical protein